MIPRKIEAMHKLYGDAPGKCANCPHFRIHRIANSYHKCTAYGVSGGASTDWRKNWKACGLIEKSLPEGEPVHDRLIELFVDDPLPGQVTMEEVMDSVGSNVDGPTIYPG